VDISPSRLKKVEIVANRVSLIGQNFKVWAQVHLCAIFKKWVLPAQKTLGLVSLVGLEASSFINYIDQGLNFSNAMFNQVFASRWKLKDFLFDLSWI